MHNMDYFYLNGCKNLLSRVLELGFLDLVLEKDSSSPYLRRLSYPYKDEAMEWFESTEMYYSSFEHCCQVLNLHPAQIRIHAYNVYKTGTFDRYQCGDKLFMYADIKNGVKYQRSRTFWERRAKNRVAHPDLPPKLYEILDKSFDEEESCPELASVA